MARFRVVTLEGWAESGHHRKPGASFTVQDIATNYAVVGVFRSEDYRPFSASVQASELAKAVGLHPARVRKIMSKKASAAKKAVTIALHERVRAVAAEMGYRGNKWTRITGTGCERAREAAEQRCAELEAEYGDGRAAA